MSLEELTATGLERCEPALLTELLIDAYNAWNHPKNALRGPIEAAGIDVTDFHERLSDLGEELADQEIDHELAKGDVVDAFSSIREVKAEATRLIARFRTLVALPLGQGVSGAKRLQRVGEVRKVDADAPLRNLLLVLRAMGRELDRANGAFARFGLGTSLRDEAKRLAEAITQFRKTRLHTEIDRSAVGTLVGDAADEARELLLELDVMARGAMLAGDVEVPRPWIATVHRLLGTKDAAADARRVAELASHDGTHPADPARARAEAAFDALLDEVDPPTRPAARPPGVA